ncbi:MAG: FprA family A-type flavoprotein [Chloroflexi bacterium]|nr:FprA family A-type flavoprotein [Chloroflexota bacterium]MCL5074893.1 FprA family A-type flavoprotein [Chloroflexota bacterium]
MEPVKMKDGLYWIGSLDPDLRTFDIIFRTERGTTYNSYLVRGTEKTAVIDTVKARFQEEFISKIKVLIDPREIDYIVLNHTEPDHSGALPKLLEAATSARLIISKPANHFVRNLFNRDLDPWVVGDGDTVDLGGRTLRFISAPFLHWPDTMFTYLVEDKILFPCDAFSCHFCDDRLYNDLVDDFSAYFRYYFNGIMRPFKEQVQKAVERIRGLEIEIVAPSHGPILRHNPWEYINRYAEWSRLPKPGAKKVLIFYVSIYGNTRAMAEEIARGASIDGVEVRLLDVTQIKPDQILDEVEAAAAIVIGSPTVCGDALPLIWELLSSLTTIRLRGKVGAAFGSYAWSGEAVPMIEERLKSLHFKVIEPGLKVTLAPTEDDRRRARELGRQIAESL